jgi:hypothetical protein
MSRHEDGTPFHTPCSTALASLPLSFLHLAVPARFIFLKRAVLNFLSSLENLGHLHPNSTSGQLPPRILRRTFVHEV